MELPWVYCCLLMVAYDVLGLELVPDVTTVIKYNSTDLASSLNYIKELNQFMANYTPVFAAPDQITRCVQGEPPSEESETYCAVDHHDAGDCTSRNGYNYISSTKGPCIFLTPTNYNNWIPEYYNSETIPEDMPEYLKEHILETENRHGSNSNLLKVVWVSCKGESSIDDENIGSIQYYPKIGFDGQYFPFKKKNYYIKPFVALLFVKPKRGVPIRVHCKTWVRNREQSLYFKILVHE